MLILGRREGESILIEGGIRIVIVACDRGGVRIGIEAPADVKILRGEIAERVAQEKPARDRQHRWIAVACVTRACT